MTTHFHTPEKSRPLWQVLLAPMLLASLGLHGLVLLLPSGSSDPAVIPPPDPEQDSVAITRVPPAGTSDVATAPAAAPVVVATAPTAPQSLVTRPGAAVAQGQPSPPATRPRVTAAQPRANQGDRSSPPPATNPSAPAASNPTPAPTAPPTPPAAPASRPLFDAAMGERLLTYVAGLNLPEAQVARAAESIQNRFAFNPDGITRAALNANQRQWEAAIRQETGLPELTPEAARTSFSTVYPQRVCLSDEPGEIGLGALVNPDGSWQGKPVLLRSSGYGALDRKALQEIQSHRFAPADGIRAYILAVETSVNYGPRPCLAPNPQS